MIYRGQQITYRELWSEIALLASELRESFQTGELLGIWLPNGPEFLTICCACLRAGVVPMPLHHGMKWSEVSKILDHTGVSYLVTSTEILSAYRQSLAGTNLQRIYAIDQNRLSERFRSGSEFGCNESIHEGGRALPEDLGLVLHTSGSKGHPKSVMISRQSIDHIVRCRLAHTGLTSTSVAVVASCLTQSVGLYQALAVLASGGTIVLLDSYDVDRMAECVNRHRPTHLIMVVGAFDSLLHHSTIDGKSFDNLSFAAVGGDRVTSRVQDRFIALTGRPLSVTYGLTESSWALINAGERMDKRLALGKPCPEVEIKVLDAHGMEASVGEVGELHIKSPKTMLGYLFEEESTRAILVDGWLASGDLAYRDDDGYYWFAGRKKGIIVLSTGDNVSPVEVENVIVSHPGVAGCAVLGVATPEGSEVACALLTRLDPQLTEETLVAFLRSRISDYKIPARIVFLRALPVGITGKVLSDPAKFFEYTSAV